MKNLDVVKLVKNQVIVSLLMKVKLSKLEHYFMRNNRKFLLKVNDSSSSSSSDFSEKFIDKEITFLKWQQEGDKILELENLADLALRKHSKIKKKRKLQSGELS